MSHFVTFLRKELVEAAHTYRLLTVLAVFAGLGILSPLTAKLLPDLLAAAMPEGLLAVLPEPNAEASWTQFFKNVSQLGLTVLVIINSSTLSAEVGSGTLVVLLARGLDRPAVVLAKYASMLLAWSVGLLLSLTLTGAYTAWFWPGGVAGDLPFALFGLWLFGAFLLALLMLAAALAKGASGALLVVGAALLAMLLVGIVPAAERYNPLSLASLGTALAMGLRQPADLYWAVIVTIGLSLLSLLAAVLAFRRRQL